MSNFADGSPFSAEGLDSIVDAVDHNAILSGGVPSVGTGNYDIDLTACDYVISGTDYSIAGDTVTLSSASASDRVDLVTADTTPGFNVVEGNPATNPNAPDIPTNEVLIAAVFVDSGGTSLATSDINEYRVVLTRNATTYKGNDIDSDGDGKVNDADAADLADDSNQLNGLAATAYEPFDTTDDQSETSRQSASSGSGTTDLVNTSGSGFLQHAFIQTNNSSASVDVTVDGGTTQTYGGWLDLLGDGSTYVQILPMLKYDSSLVVTLDPAGNFIRGQATLK